MDDLAAQASDNDDDAPEIRAWMVDAASHGARLDHALVARAGEFSRSHLQSLVARGEVRIDDAVCRTPARRLRLGQRVEVQLLPTAESRAFRAEPMALAVVHEDEALLVVDKPAGLVVHPAAGHWSGTLLNGLLAHHAGAAGLPRAGIVHRLDKDTSGLMVVAKTLQSMTALVRMIAARKVQREYLALAHGEFAQAERSIEAPIARDPRSRVRMAVLGSGKPARTDVQRLAARDGASALRCTLHTGRTHQIRVHLAHVGHPLLADALYGGVPALGVERQALHATSLRFAHPLDARRPLAFESALPADLQAAWAAVTQA
jgi:23S rRNA pseudouridine1911/1915/1917 synthase